MKASSKPLTWVSGNVVYARHMRDPWAVFVIGTESHECAEPAERLAAFDAHRAMLVELGADTQLLRVHRFWDADAYIDGHDVRGGEHADTRERYLREQATELDGSWAAPMVVLSVSLSQTKAHASERAGEALADPRAQLEETRAALRGISAGSWSRSQADVDADHDRADEVLAQLCSYLPDARAASLPEVEWLVRRAWTRGIGDPVVDGLDEPRALVFERNGQSALKPESVDLLRWTDYVHRGYRQLRVEGELGTSFQTGLIASSMPGDAEEGSRALELLLGPQGRLAFAVDVSICAKYVSPSRARKAVDNERARADEAAREEHTASRGASDQTLLRTEVARDAEAYLANGLPLFEMNLTVIVAGEDERELAARVRETISVFRAYGVTLRLPVGQQLEVFFEHLPAQRAWTQGFVRRVSADQLAAMAPRAAHRLGGRHGYVWGHVGTARQPQTIARWSPLDGSRYNTAAGVLIVGDSGSGKTTAAAKLTTEAFLDGAAIFDFTGKSDDHHWHTWPQVAPHADVIELDADQAKWRGLLDPWLNAPKELQRDAATDFLRSLLPRDVPHTWSTALLSAVDVVATRSLQPSNIEVLEALEQRGEIAAHIAEHLRVQSRSGLAQLGFGDRATGRVRELGDKQVTHVEMENLPVPESGVDRGDYDEMEMQGSALAKLIALLGLGLLSRQPADRLKVFNFDEVKGLLDHASGRKVVDQLMRLGRSKKAVPVLQTQYATDIDERTSVGSLFGSVWCFRAPNEEQALRSLELLQRTPTKRLVRDLQDRDAPAGRALVRDHAGRVEWLQVTLPSTLKQRVETNPFEREAARA